LSVLMPVFNESRTLRTIVGRVMAAPVEADLELVCVDDYSTDDSLSILRELAEEDPRIRVAAQPFNMGKGRAIRTAIEHMTGDIAIVQDADLEYDPNEYQRVLQPILDGRADAVYGSRFAASEQRRVLFFWHALGNRLLTLLSNMANDLNLTDMETCYKAVRADVLKRLRLTSDRFGFEPEITARLAQWGARIYEVPISYHGRTYAEGKNIGWRDGVEALWLILKFRFFDTKATSDDSVVIRQSLGRAPRFRNWMLEAFRPYLGGTVVELNAGPGHTTAHLLELQRLIVTDSDPVHVDTLRRRFGHLENVETRMLDIENEDYDFEPVSTALLLDGLQRAEEPKQLLSNVSNCVDPGGHVLIQVPAGKDLYGPTDRAAGHVRRFDEEELRELIRACGMEVLQLESFNRVGRWGWRIHHGLGVGAISSGEARLFDLLVPIARRLEASVPGQGLSFLAVARVP
ncbi:MAG: glycosyltransferase, partial [Rhodothermales bacterium]|nr:glycosyltransferase [Rhodothermales bacterium]